MEMTQNMCVTIDEEIHTWLKNKSGMMSRRVNRILRDSMIAEMQEKDERPHKECVGCRSTFRTERMYCPKHWCNLDLKVIE